MSNRASSSVSVWPSSRKSSSSRLLRVGSASALNTSSTPPRIGDQSVTCQPSARRSLSSARCCTTSRCGFPTSDGPTILELAARAASATSATRRSPTSRCSAIRAGSAWRWSSRATWCRACSTAGSGPGLNHLAFRVDGDVTLADLVAEAPDHGWAPMSTDGAHPIAGGADVAYLEDRDGFEVELVREPSGVAEPRFAGSPRQTERWLAVHPAATSAGKPPVAIGPQRSMVMRRATCPAGASRRGTRPSRVLTGDARGSTRRGRRARRACRAPRPARRPARTRRSSRRTARRSTRAGHDGRCSPWHGRGYVDTTMRPSPSTPHVTGDSCGRRRAGSSRASRGDGSAGTRASSSRSTVRAVAMLGLMTPSSCSCDVLLEGRLRP